MDSGCGGHGENRDADLKLLMDYPLELELELLDVDTPGTYDKQAWEFSVMEKWLSLPKLREEGAVLLRKGRARAAEAKFHRCIEFLESIQNHPTINELLREEARVAKKLRDPVGKEDVFEDAIASVEEMELKNRTAWKDVVIACTENPELARAVDLDQFREQTVVSRLNYAQCLQRREEYADVIKQCTILIDGGDPIAPDFMSLSVPVNPRTTPRKATNPWVKADKMSKAHFRRGQAYLRIGRDLEMVEYDFEMTLNYSSTLEEGPLTATDVKKALEPEQRTLKAKWAEHRQRERAMFQGKMSVS